MHLFAKRSTTPVHNPASNLRIGSGLAKVKEFLAAGVNVDWEPTAQRIQTAARTCSTRCSSLRCIRITGSDFNRWVTRHKALAMATRNGALAFGFDAA